MKHFITYLDILGFDERARLEAERSNRPSADIRSSYVSSIESRLRNLKNNNKLIKFVNASMDSWIIFTDDFLKSLQCLIDLLDTGLDFEIASCSRDLPEPVSTLYSYHDELIGFLKSAIIPKYKSKYQTDYGLSPKSSFIIFDFDFPRALNNIWICRNLREMVMPDGERIYSMELETLRKIVDLYAFLDKIGSHKLEFIAINELYVEPIGYERMYEMLEEKNILFLIGDPEMGKTYTSIRLLFDLYKRGYEPLRIREEDVIRILEDREELDNRAIYLEDPWGILEFKRNDRQFQIIRDLIQKRDSINIKIIISSRLQIFSEYKRYCESGLELINLSSDLRIDLAYDRTRLCRILQKYLDHFVPPWSQDKNLRAVAFNSIGNTLKTPMSIRKLSMSYEIKSKEDLLEEITKASEETKITFSKEITELFQRGFYEYIIFYGLAYARVSRKECEPLFNSLVTEIEGIDPIRSKTFNYLFESYNNRKVHIEFGDLKFIHDSYEEAFIRSLTDDGEYPNNISIKLISPMIWKISKDPTSAFLIIRIIRELFDYIEFTLRIELLCELSKIEDINIIASVCLIINEEYGKVPAENIKIILINLSKNKSYNIRTIQFLKYILFEHICEFEEQFVEVILKSLLMDDEEYRAILVSDICVARSEDISIKTIDEIISILLKNTSGLASGIWIMANIHDRNPSKYVSLLKAFSKDDSTSAKVSFALCGTIRQFQAELAMNLLIELSKRKSSARHVACIIYLNSEMIEPSKLKELLINLIYCSHPHDGTTRNYAKCILLHNINKFSRQDIDYLRDNVFQGEITEEMHERYKDFYNLMNIEIYTIWRDEFSGLKNAYPEKLRK